MTAHELLTILSRLPHDAVISVNVGGDLLEVDQITVQMSTDLYEHRDHIIIELEKEF